MSITQLVSIIPDWLAVTAGRELAIGLSREDALRRASVLRGLLREGRLDPAQVVLDEDLKAVFHAVVALVTEIDRGGEPSAEEADGVYQFLARVEWPGDDFDEKRELLRCLAEAGWRVMGMSFAEVERRRSAGESFETIHHFRTDPIRLATILMPETARLLRFPGRRGSSSLSPDEAKTRASSFLATPVEDRSPDLWDSVLREPDALFALCSDLKSRMNSAPAQVAEELPPIYRAVAEHRFSVGLFDEREYLLGEIALIGGTVFRHIGRLDQAERWLDRAEASFRHVVNPAPLLTNVAYARLALRYTMRRYEEVLELAPSLIRSFERLGMGREMAKSRFLEAMTLKESGKALESIERFQSLGEALQGRDEDTGLLGLVLIEIGAYQGVQGNLDEAVCVYERALAVMGNSADPMALAHLKGVIGETYRAKGDVEGGAKAFRMAIADYASLGMALRTAYYRVVLAETLVALGRPREAEWEILQALPTIDEQKMVPEGFAAVALLRESVKQRKADPNALRELREHLQKQN